MSATPLPDTMTVREARTSYFRDNGFGETGGYDDPWVDFKLGPIPMPFPNTKARVEAVRFHDVHHLLTGYTTDILGELEISGWELGAGCKGYSAAWVLNLSGLALGLFVAPRRCCAAFVRGRGHQTTYGEPIEEVLDLPLASARRRFTGPAGDERRATFGDVVLFAIAVTVGVALSTLVLFPLVVPLVPLGLCAHALRRRRARAQETGGVTEAGRGSSSATPTR